MEQSKYISGATAINAEATQKLRLYNSAIKSYFLWLEVVPIWTIASLRQDSKTNHQTSELII